MKCILTFETTLRLPSNLFSASWFPFSSVLTKHCCIFSAVVHTAVSAYDQVPVMHVLPSSLTYDNIGIASFAFSLSYCFLVDPLRDCRRGNFKNWNGKDAVVPSHATSTFDSSPCVLSIAITFRTKKRPCSRHSGQSSWNVIQNLFRYLCNI